MYVCDDNNCHSSIRLTQLHSRELSGDPNNDKVPHPQQLQGQDRWLPGVRERHPPRVQKDGLGVMALDLSIRGRVQEVSHQVPESIPMGVSFKSEDKAGGEGERETATIILKVLLLSHVRTLSEVKRPRAIYGTSSKAVTHGRRASVNLQKRRAVTGACNGMCPACGDTRMFTVVPLTTTEALLKST